jgi:hypothetical protein
MAETGSGRIWWIAILIVLFLAFTGLFWPYLDDEESAENKFAETAVPKDPMVDSVSVLSWEWRDDRTGSLFAVWGVVKNESSQTLGEVVLQLRTVDEDSNTIARHTIKANDLAPLGTKPFREDIPRTGRENKGFLTVLRVIP